MPFYLESLSKIDLKTGRAKKSATGEVALRK
jgi:hypothetical protein